jgi:hypothetical protein
MFAGFRPPVGRVALALGISVSAAVVQTKANGGSTIVEGTGEGNSTEVVVTDAVSGRSTEARTGAYVAAVWPLFPRLRLRPQLSFEAVAFRMGTTVTHTQSLPAAQIVPLQNLPGWSASNAFAVEVSAL